MSKHWISISEMGFVSLINPNHAISVPDDLTLRDLDERVRTTTEGTEHASRGRTRES